MQILLDENWSLMQSNKMAQDVLFLIRSQGSMDAIIYVQATPAQLQCVLVQFSRINLERKKIKSKIKNFKLNNMFSRR